MKALIRKNNQISLDDVNLSVNSKDVLLKVNTVGLCRTDLLVAKGKISTKIQDIILGHEFCGTVENDPRNLFSKGQLVGVNPLWDSKFMGLDFHGAICEYIYVPHDKIISTTLSDYRMIAYLEPIAASMAVLKVINPTEDKSIVIIGKNRISILTKIILDSFNIACEIIDENELQGENRYDVIIESVMTDDLFSRMIKALKTGKTLIIKSRKKEPINFFASDLVAKEVNIKAVNYYDYNLTMNWLEKNYALITPLLGDIFPLSSWKEAFDLANSNEQKKIFIGI